MIRTEVQSKMLKSVGYDSSSHLLEVEFHHGNKVYTYQGVPPAVFEAFTKAESKGSFFSRYIRKGYVHYQHQGTGALG